MYEGVVRRRVAPVSIDRRPILGMLFPIPVVCFLGALLTDERVCSTESTIVPPSPSAR